MNHLKASDAELLVASDKDAAAFRALYNRYTEQINGYHLRRCRDEQAALDLTAETFAQAWCARRAFRTDVFGAGLQRADTQVTVHSAATSMLPIATAINATVPVPTRRNGAVPFVTMKACCRQALDRGKAPPNRRVLRSPRGPRTSCGRLRSCANPITCCDMGDDPLRGRQECGPGHGAVDPVLPRFAHARVRRNRFGRLQGGRRFGWQRAASAGD